MFIDLQKAVCSLTSVTVVDRAKEFADRYPGVFISGVGGFPIIESDGEPTWAGSSITPKKLSIHIINALGASGVLTYMNRNNLQLSQLGAICIKGGHDWAFHWTTISIVLSGYDPAVEWALARNGKFYLSWPVIPSKSLGHSPVFVASGSLHTWRKFVGHVDDPDFTSSVRSAMNDINYILKQMGL